MTRGALFLPLILTGCSGISTVVMQDNYNNYMTFEHPFTDDAARDVLGKAERLCQQRKQAAIRTECVCWLTKCVTSYQCVAKADAARFAQ